MAGTTGELHPSVRTAGEFDVAPSDFASFDVAWAATALQTRQTSPRLRPRPDHPPGGRPPRPGGFWCGTRASEPQISSRPPCWRSATSRRRPPRPPRPPAIRSRSRRPPPWPPVVETPQAPVPENTSASPANLAAETQDAAGQAETPPHEIGRPLPMPPTPERIAAHLKIPQIKRARPICCRLPQRYGMPRR